MRFARYTVLIGLVAASLVGSASFATGARAALPESAGARQQGLFHAVAALSPSNVWLVGYWQIPHGTSHSMIRHWDGSAWSVVPAPDPGTSSQLLAVSAASPDDIWASGWYYDPNAAWPYVTLMDHWDGTAWTQVATDPAQPYALTAVSADAANDAWAVGVEFAEHWDGSTWTVTPTPKCDGGCYFTSVTAISPTDAYLAGTSRGNGVTIVDRWDGTQWTQLKTLDPHGHNVFLGVSATSDADVWAAGWTGGRGYTLIEHWDGARWVRSGPHLRLAHFNEVAARTADDAWVVGLHGDYWGGKGLIEHWDGSSWVKTPSPQLRGRYKLDLLAVAASTPSDAWAVGFRETNDYDTEYPWVEHWDGIAWTKVEGIP